MTRLLIELIPPILALTILHIFDYTSHKNEMRGHKQRDHQFGEQHFKRTRKRFEKQEQK